MANEHSIRVSARGEFGQLERGLKNLQKDLNSVLGEIDKGARRGGIFDETQLRALDLYRGRFKGTMDELNREFEKQNKVVDELHRKKETASRSEQADLSKVIQKREKQLDVLRREIRAMEDLNNSREKEASTYSKSQNQQSDAPSGGSGLGQPSGGGGAGGAGLLGAGLAKIAGASKFMVGLAGIAGIASMAGEAYNLALQSQTRPMDLSQRLRGNGYEGSAKNMWDEVGNVGRNDSMGYTSEESWSFQDQYSRQAGAMNTQEMEDSLKFGRGYGLDVGETAGALSSVRELGGTTSATEFADLIAGSVEKSGMTPRILEVMQTSAGLLATMNTSLKDTGAKQILAYQTTLDTIGMEKGMMKLTGAQGANIIGGLGGIYSPQQENPWKYMGMQALQRHDPEKYGEMGLYDLETNFEDGLMNKDNLPAMAGLLKEKSGGDENLEKRMLQKWLQDGGYNATKRQTNDLYEATDGMTAFDEDKMKKVTDDIEAGDGTEKYQERMGQLGQDILDTNARFEKQLENLGQPLVEIVQGLKEGFTSLLEELTDEEGVDILGFLEDNWGLLASALGITGLASLLGKLIPVGGGKTPKNGKDGKDGSDGSDDDGNGDNENKPKPKSKPPIIPVVPPGVLGGLAKGLLRGGGILGGAKAIFDTLNGDDESKQKKLMEDNGYTKEQIGDNTGFADRLATNLINGLTFGLFSPEKQISTFSPDGTQELLESTEGFFKMFDKNWDVPKTPEQEEAYKKQVEKMSDPEYQQPFQASNPTTWLSGLEGIEVTLPKPMQDWLSGVQERLAKETEPMTGKDGMWDLDGGKRQQAVDALVGLGTSGSVNIAGMSDHGKAKLQELAEQGLIKLEEGKVAQTTTLSGFTDAGKANLLKLADDGLISIGGFTEDGKAKITVLSDAGKKELEALQANGSVNLSDFKEEGTLQITSLSEKGAEELIDLQKNGSLSLDGMDTTTDEKLEKVRKLTETKLGDIEGEHKSWSDKLVGKDGIFTKWADGFGKLWDDLVKTLTDLLPGWLGGSGDSEIGALEGGGTPITKQSEALRGKVEKAGDKHGIGDTDLLLAIMNQESKGYLSKDVFQSSESLGLARNSLGTDASIEQGVKYFSEALEKAGGDVEMALQAYNYGHGYIKYAKDKGGHSEEVARAYQKKMGGNYGDENYAKNVLQYYPQGNQGNQGEFFDGWQNRVTSEYGANEDFRGHTHRGLDIDGDQGDAVQAVKGGTVSFIKYDDGSKKDSDGKKNTRSGGTELGIKMSNGETYFYSHLSKIANGLKAGDKVNAGDYLANVGGDRGKAGSGTSTTGSHLHLGYMDKGGHLQDPKGWLNSLSAGDSDIGISSDSASKRDITITLKLDGEGATQLNSMTESNLRAMVNNAIKEYERMKMMLNPTTGGH